MEKVFCGKRVVGEAGPGQVWVNGKILSPERSLKVARHSPSGFQWGYNGSGPAQLALALLLEATGSVRRSRYLYQQFKCQVVAGLAAQWVLTGREIEEWSIKVDHEVIDGREGENAEETSRLRGRASTLETASEGPNAGGRLPILENGEGPPRE